MRCHICNMPLSEPTWNNDHQGFEPCGTCLEIINDVVASYKDKASADEDAFGEEPMFTGLFPSALEPEFI